MLNQMRNQIRTRQYIMTIHAEEEMDDGDLTIFDVESVVLTGAVAERQRTPRRAHGSMSFGARPSVATVRPS